MSFRSGATIVKETSLSPWLVIVKSVSEDPPPYTHKKNHHQNLPKLTIKKSWDSVFFFVLNTCAITYLTNKIYNAIRYYSSLNNYS